MKYQRAQAAIIIGGVLATSWLLPSLASEEAADRRTQDALAMDAHPRNGAAPFMRYCSSCHGGMGQGDAERLIPAVAGQRFNYLVRQIANFGSAERDNWAIHQVLANKGFAEPQMWGDVASYLSRLPAVPNRKLGVGFQTVRGRRIFHVQCATCHEADAGGDKEGFVPSLRNQSYGYLVNQ